MLLLITAINNAKTGNNGTKNVEIMVPLKYLSNFWRTHKMPLINCEISLDLNWSKNCIIVVTDAADQIITFSITDKNYIPVVNLSTEDNTKLLEQLKSSFKTIIKCHKYQSKTWTEKQNQYINYLNDPNFQEVNKLFFLSFEKEEQRKSSKLYYLSTVETKNYVILMDKYFFINQWEIFNNIW